MYCYLCVHVYVCVFTLNAAPRPHAGLEVLSMWTRHAEVQLGLQHPLPHPAALLTGGAAACRPGGPARVDTSLRCVVWERNTQGCSVNSDILHLNHIFIAG